MISGDRIVDICNWVERCFVGVALTGKDVFGFDFNGTYLQCIHSY
jgi:hypothetical protein